MALAPPLRFSTFLRNGTELAEALPLVDPETLAVLRQRVISSRSKTRLRQEAFTWANISRNLQNASSRVVAELQKVFNAFIVACKDVVAESAEVEGMTAAVAELIYSSACEAKAAGGDVGDDAAARRDMLRDLGTVDEAALGRALPLAQQLAELAGAATAAGASPGGLLSPSTMGPSGREYGRDLAIDNVFSHASEIELAMADAALLEQCQKQRRAFLDSQRKSSYGSFNTGVGSRVPGTTSTATTSSSSSSSSFSSSGAGDTGSGGGGGSGGGSGGGVNALWLLRKCEQHLMMSPHALFDAGQMAEELLNAVKHARGGADELQMTLFDLLGADGFEFIVEVVQHAKALLAIKPAALAAAAQSSGNSTGGVGGGGGGSAVGGGKTLNPNSQKGRAALRRQERELEEANRQMLQEIEAMQSGSGGGGGAAGGGAGAGAGAGGAAKEKSAREIFGLGSTQGATFRRTNLPSGAVREDKEGYSVVNIPAKPRPTVDPSQLVSTAEFDEFARPAFAGVPYLNRLQSDLFQVAYRSNRNLLICAPTGAGKTNVALMAVLREIKANMDESSGMIDREAFKIIYVAPMKALAQEIVTKFQNSLRCAGCRRCGCGGCGCKEQAKQEEACEL
jgi:hypothetical protein